MGVLVDRMAAVYREELGLYRRVLELVKNERAAILAFRPLGEIVESLEAKRDLLRTIESMERTIATEKAHYQRNKRLIDLGVTFELNQTIKEIKGVIQEIMAIEEENERAIIEQGGEQYAAGGGMRNGDQGHAW